MRQHMVGAMAIAGLVLGSAGALRGEDFLVEGSEEAEVPQIEYTVCGQGVLKECGKYTSKQCTQYMPSSGSGGVTYGPGSGGVTGSLSGTCISWTDVEIKLYKDRYVKPVAKA